MLVLSITLHNIPEGLAVGVAFGVLQNGGYTTESLMGAISVAVGIGLQNFPEGAAVVEKLDIFSEILISCLGSGRIWAFEHKYYYGRPSHSQNQMKNKHFRVFDAFTRN